MPRSPIVAVLLTFGLAACADEGSSPPASDGGMARLEMGGGEWQFEPLMDGDTVELVLGGQGGYHIWVSLRTQELDPNGVQMTLTTEVLSVADTESVTIYTVDLDPTPEPGTHRLIGWPAVLPEPGCADGRELAVQVELVDAEGRWATDERVVIPEATSTPPPCP
ncbi:MAG: hypothetical protein ACOCV4_04195 [Myxococcota bacterium]